MELLAPRLVLREFEANDWRAVLNYQTDVRYTRCYPPAERSEREARAFVDRFIAWQAEEPRIKYQLAITLKAEGRLIGNCGLRMTEAGAHEAELGYELNPDYWGRGCVTEAAAALVEWGFAQLGLHRVWAWCIAENERSARVLERLGMRPEGRQREKVWMRDRWADVLLYGILAHEWREGRSVK
jgi:ribosomal-protein-alanine N-acetyltransferase